MGDSCIRKRKLYGADNVPFDRRKSISMTCTAEDLFEMAARLSADSTKRLEWLQALRDDANEGQSAWLEMLNGFVRGLWAAGMIDLCDVDYFDKLRCQTMK